MSYTTTIETRLRALRTDLTNYPTYIFRANSNVRSTYPMCTWEDDILRNYHAPYIYDDQGDPVKSSTGVHMRAIIPKSDGQAISTISAEIADHIHEKYNVPLSNDPHDSLHALARTLNRLLSRMVPKGPDDEAAMIYNLLGDYRYTGFIKLTNTFMDISYAPAAMKYTVAPNSASIGAQGLAELSEDLRYASAVPRTPVHSEPAAYHGKRYDGRIDVIHDYIGVTTCGNTGHSKTRLLEVQEQRPTTLIDIEDALRKPNIEVRRYLHPMTLDVEGKSFELHLPPKEDGLEIVAVVGEPSPDERNLITVLLPSDFRILPERLGDYYYVDPWSGIVVPNLKRKATPSELRQNNNDPQVQTFPRHYTRMRTNGIYESLFNNEIYEHLTNATVESPFFREARDQMKLLLMAIDAASVFGSRNFLRWFSASHFMLPNGNRTGMDITGLSSYNLNQPLIERNVERWLFGQLYSVNSSYGARVPMSKNISMSIMTPVNQGSIVIGNPISNKIANLLTAAAKNVEVNKYPYVKEFFSRAISNKTNNPAGFEQHFDRLSDEATVLGIYVIDDRTLSAPMTHIKVIDPMKNIIDKHAVDKVLTLPLINFRIKGERIPFTTMGATKMIMLYHQVVKLVYRAVCFRYPAMSQDAFYKALTYDKSSTKELFPPTYAYMNKNYLSACFLNVSTRTQTDVLKSHIDTFMATYRTLSDSKWSSAELAHKIAFRMLMTGKINDLDCVYVGCKYQPSSVFNFKGKNGTVGSYDGHKFINAQVASEECRFSIADFNTVAEPSADEKERYHVTFPSLPPFS